MQADTKHPFVTSFGAGVLAGLAATWLLARAPEPAPSGLLLLPPPAPSPDPETFAEPEPVAAPRPRSRVRRALSALSTLLVLAIVVLWAVELRPAFLGGPASFAVVSGTSMLPTLHTGDVVVVHRQSSYAVGDVIAYKVPKGDVAHDAQVIHRIIGGDGVHGFIVQGDNRTAPDIWHPKTGDVVGKQWAHVPHAGVVVRLLHTPFFLAALLASITVAFVVGGGRKREDEDAG